MDEVVRDQPPKISISVVSHKQADLVSLLLSDIELHCSEDSIELILTLNLEEELPFTPDNFSFPIRMIHNKTRQGFGENHNKAFMQSKGQFFCILNPDIRLKSNPFPLLVDCLNDDSVGVVAPLVLGEDNEIGDSARHFPTPFKIVAKAFGYYKGSDYEITEQPIKPDWVGGMFLLFKRNMFEGLNGFDQRYFLYYEDVDICARLRLLGYDVLFNPQVRVFHYAQRTSHANYEYLKVHLTSMIRFFLSPVFWRVQFQKRVCRDNIKRR